MAKTCLVNMLHFFKVYRYLPRFQTIRIVQLQLDFKKITTWKVVRHFF